MQNVLFLFLRRMRAPLILLIVVYAVSITGLVLMPGVDENGERWHMSFFHAYYFVNFMATTIGFGEIPHPFTEAQRIWVSACILLTVVSWLYAIGRILSLIQDPAFARAVTEARFIRAANAIKVPYYIVCGYGETGSLLVRALARRNIQCVVLDSNTERLNALSLENLGMDIPAMAADASETRHLEEAGLRRKQCLGVVTVTDSDDVNIRVALTAKLLHPSLTVISRCATQETAQNLASFGTDHIISPHEVFGEHFTMTLHNPSLHLLHAWLISLPGKRLQGPVKPPRGEWVICGYGRFGKTLQQCLHAANCTTRVIEHRPDFMPEGAVKGRGHELQPLREAGVATAQGIVAGLDRDTNTLSAVMTARALNPRLYVVARQFRRASSQIFDAAGVDLVMEPSRLIVWRILPLITRPLLSHFLRLLRAHSEEFGDSVLDKIRACCGELTPDSWSVCLDPEHAPAVCAALSAGCRVSLGDLLRDPRQRRRKNPGMVLLHQRGSTDLLIPAADIELQTGDSILFCGPPSTRKSMEWTLNSRKMLEYVRTGKQMPDGHLWRWLSQRWKSSRDR